MSIASLMEKSARCRETAACPRGRVRVILILLSMALGCSAQAQAPLVETHGAQSPAVSAKGDVTISYGLGPDQMQELTKAAAAGAVGPLADRIIDLSQKLGVTQDATVTFLHTLGQQEVPLERLTQKLHDIAEQYKSAMQRLAALDADDPATRDLVARAKSAIEAGHLDEADRLMNRAEQADLAAIQKLQDMVDQRRLRAAAKSEVRGNIAMAQLHYLDAAQHFGKAAGLVPAGHPDEKERYLLGKADALYLQGDERGDNSALGDAIATYNLALHEVERDREPLQWAVTQNKLGNALMSLGARETETAKLQLAVAAYRAALAAAAAYYAGLEEDLRGRVLWVHWAMIQMNLGSALTTLGQRENGTAHLEEAVVAYRAALGERTRERVPLDWAMTENNLGCALLRLGEREGSSVRLVEAVVAYRTALEERTRERVPLDWGITRNNLGNALLELGQRENGTTRLEEAIRAYHAALKELTRERVPLHWAETKNSLGVARWTLAGRETGAAQQKQLKKAVAAFRLALQERTQDRVPLDWAMTQNNMGMALKALGEQDRETEHLEEAVAAYGAALEVYTPDKTPLSWAMTQMNLGNVLQILGARESGAVHLEDAVAVYRKALTLVPTPIAQANIEFNMGLALTLLGHRTQSVDSLKEALVSFRQACAVFRAVGMLQLSIPCDQAIAPLRDKLEPSSPSANEPSKPAG